MALAFEDVFGVREAFTGIAMPGRTDAWILSGAAEAHGIPAGARGIERFRAAYLHHLSREIERPAGGLRKGVMPGIRPLLEALTARPDIYLALLTGNYEAGARLKLEYFDLWRYFRCGAYGDDLPDRNALLPLALTRIVECDGPAVRPGQVVIVGDTPFDIACALAGGARSLGVATGSHRAGEFLGAGADVVFETLADTAAVIEAIGALTRSSNEPR
jgi:phosphoglycolate phosphatase-like HAD superfamily hydrolase